MKIRRYLNFIKEVEGLQSVTRTSWTQSGRQESTAERSWRLVLFVKALDKAETIIQHNQGQNPSDFNYEFNLTYGQKYFEEGAFLKGLRAELDRETRNKIDN